MLDVLRVRRQIKTQLFMSWLTRGVRQMARKDKNPPLTPTAGKAKAANIAAEKKANNRIQNDLNSKKKPITPDIVERGEARTNLRDIGRT